MCEQNCVRNDHNDAAVGRYQQKINKKIKRKSDPQGVGKRLPVEGVNNQRYIRQQKTKKKTRNEKTPTPSKAGQLQR